MIVYTAVPLILCATLVLTSSVNKSATDASSTDNQHVLSSKSVDSSTTILPNLSKTHQKNETDSLIFTEGGPISRVNSKESSKYVDKELSTSSKLTDETFDGSTSKVSNETRSKDPKPRNASVVGRKGAIPSPKITPRKGVGPELSPTVESTTESNDEDAALPSKEENTKMKKIHPISEQISDESDKESIEKAQFSQNAKVNESKIESKKNSSQIHSNESTTRSSIVKTVPTVAQEIKKNEIKAGSKKFKPKPTVTIGEMEIDKPIPASPTKTPPLGMPRKIDYIVPVIITIMAVPLLGAATFFLYRRGRDCWDKRHYRRMDFLIDGMYNDYSWK